MTLARINSMVKRANQRFRQLEKSNMTYSSAYKYMVNQLKSGRQYLTTDSKGRIKFRTDVSRLKKQNASSFNALVKNVETFLNANTSTVKGVKNQYIKGFETFRNSDKRLKDYTYDEFYEIMESSSVQQAMGTYGSEQVLELYEKYSDELSINEFERLLTANNGQPISNIEDDITSYYVFKENTDFNIDDWFTNSDSEDIPF